MRPHAAGTSRSDRLRTAGVMRPHAPTTDFTQRGGWGLRPHAAGVSAIIIIHNFLQDPFYKLIFPAFRHRNNRLYRLRQ